MALARTIAVVRAFVGFAGPPRAEAQPATGTHRIAFVHIGDAASGAVDVAAPRAGLAALGTVEGRNLVIDFRRADQDEAAVTKLPVVFSTGDPVAEGVVGSYAKPGGNLAGLAVRAGDLDARRLEILKQLVPRADEVIQ